VALFGGKPMLYNFALCNLQFCSVNWSVLAGKHLQPVLTFASKLVLNLLENVNNTLAYSSEGVNYIQ
jgi:hypothetical protein